jgi:hypothetical protein
MVKYGVTIVDEGLIIIRLVFAKSDLVFFVHDPSKVVAEFVLDVGGIGLVAVAGAIVAER